MAKAKKYYAVKGDSIESVIFHSWPECQEFVKGKSVKFKSFGSYEDAEVFAYDKEVYSEGIFIFVDGSYMHGKSKYGGWGFVIVQDGIELLQENGRTKNPAESRNIDGELEATINAVKWCEKHIPGKEVTLCYDYKGIAMWAKGYWKANKELTQNYKSFMMNKDWVNFKKVAAHTGNKWNEIADTLAKEGVFKSE